MEDICKSVFNVLHRAFDISHDGKLKASPLESFVDIEHFGSLLPFDEIIETILCSMVQFFDEKEALEVVKIFFDFCLRFETKLLKWEILIWMMISYGLTLFSRYCRER